MPIQFRRPEPKCQTSRRGARGTQFGRVRHDQLRAFGIGKATIDRWLNGGFPHRLLPRVYAVGHPGRSVEGDLAAAVLYAGPGAMLSHATAAWWLELLKHPASDGLIFLSSQRRVQDRGNIVVHGRRHIRPSLHRGLPVTPPCRTLLDFAASGPPQLLRLALANADYLGLLDIDGLQKLMGQGIDGSAALRDALAIHLPELAHTRSELEILLLRFCETHQLPIPDCNIYLQGWLVDAVWQDNRLVVEVDGWQGHRTRAQLETDHQRDFELREAGYTVLRYTWRQLTDTPSAIASELRRFLQRF